MRLFISCCFVVFIALQIEAQTNLLNPANDPDWSVLMQSPAASPEQIRTQFESRWAGRARVKGSGYKQVERWLHLMDGRTNPEDGSVLDGNAAFRAYNKWSESIANGRSLEGNWKVCGPVLDDITTRDHIRGIGRMNAITFHPSDANVIFAGAPAGGLWRTYDGGQSWTCNTDDFPTLGVSGIDFAASNPATVYIGTGDRDASDSPGMGVMKSVDAGETWEFANDGISGYVVGDLRVHPENEDQVVAATSSGIFKTTDGGQSWNQVSSNTQNYKDIVQHPTNPSIMYCTGSGRFWRSEDAGDSWEYINDGIQPSTRMVIAVTPAAPDYVYVLSTGTYEYRAFYKSTDSGLNFEEMSDAPNIMGWSASGDGEGGQAWYDLCLEADPVVVDRVYAGGIRMKRSDDAGVTWLDIQDSYLHVDQHDLTANPHTNEIWLANDGGIYRYANNQQWEDRSHGIITGEIYKIGQSPFAGTNAMNGYQDNGTYLFDGIQWSRGSGGDGFECIYDPNDPNWFFSSSQYGRIYRTGPGIQSQTIVANGDLGITEGGAWSTPFTVSPENSETMFVGLLNIWRSMNIKHPVRDSIVWEKISSELGGSDANAMRVVHRHRSNENIVFAAKSNRKLFRCDNALDEADSIVWVNLSNDLPLSSNPVLSVETVFGEDSTVFISFAKKVWKSSDLGLNWEELEGELSDLPINSIVYDTTGTDALYAGSDMGVFHWDVQDSTWSNFSSGLPASVRITELELYPGAGVNDPQRLRAGTYGRGMWETDVHGESVGFPPLAFLSPSAGEAAIYGPAVVELSFRRNLETIEMEGLSIDDIQVENAVVSSMEGDGLDYLLTISPLDYGPMLLHIPDAAANEVDGFNLGNLGSDSLQLVYHPAPDAFGPFGPGGVGNSEDLAIWLRGDWGLFNSNGEALTGNETIAEWRDVASGNFVSAFQDSETASPVQAVDGINGHAAIAFDGEDDCVIAPAVELARSISAFSVVRGASNAWNEHGWIASARGSNGFILHPWKNQSSYQSVVIDDEGNYAQATPVWIVDASLPQFYGVIYDQSDWDQQFYTIINETRLPFPGSNIGARANSDLVEVRYGWDFDNRFGEGMIAEHFIYNRRLFESHRKIVTNYVGARYAMGMGNAQMYFRSMYPEDVAGIGRESEWDLHDDAQGAGAVRISDPTDMEDGEYLFWGHDGAELQVVQAYPFQTERLERIWAIEELGELGTVNFKIADAGVAELFASGSIGLIVGEGDAFDVNNQPAFYPLQNQGEYWTTSIDFPASGVFTIGFDPVMALNESMAEASWQLYPNPTDGLLNIQVRHLNPAGTTCRVLDCAGRIIYQWQWSTAQNEALDVSSWSNGLYVLEFTKSGQRHTLPFMKQ